jgi:hypothetical protein
VLANLALLLPGPLRAGLARSARWPHQSDAPQQNAFSLSARKHTRARSRMTRFLFLSLLLTWSSAVMQAQPAPRLKDTILVSDRFLGDTSVTGAIITAKFGAPEHRADLLRIDGLVRTGGGRSWLLSDILVTLDFNGNGFVAIWKVAGPRGVVEAHLDRVREMSKDRGMIYDFEIRRAAVRCACH